MTNQRPIEFRAISLEGKIIHDVGIIEWFEDGTIRVNDEIPVKELIEFTGLLDKHGKKIFEGDVVKYTFSKFSKYKHPKGLVHYHKVFWNMKKSAWWMERLGNKETNFGLATHAETHEIIGNIYSNPELLTEKNV